MNFFEDRCVPVFLNCSIPKLLYSIAITVRAIEAGEDNRDQQQCERREDAGFALRRDSDWSGAGNGGGRVADLDCGVADVSEDSEEAIGCS